MRRVLLIALLALPLAAQSRFASDFEIAQMEKQLEESYDFEPRFSARLNLGDARRSRNETSLARKEFTEAIALAEEERRIARRKSDLERYSLATGLAATAHARLGHDPQTFALLEEAIRYGSDNAYVWNTYASSMRIIGQPEKAVAAGRNAVAIAARSSRRLDLAVFQYSLATSLVDAGKEQEAEQLLRGIVELLGSRELESLRREVARTESFEVNSFVRSDVAAYVALLNRAQLYLGELYEARGDLAAARTQYERVLAARNDDVIALAGMARLARSDDDRERRYAEAFAANPFSMELVREYQDHLRTHPSTGGEGLQLALQQLARGERRAARATLDGLLARFPANDTLRTLRREAEEPRAARLPSAIPSADELRALLSAFESLTAEQRAALDHTTYTSSVRFAGEQFASGTIEGVPFRFTAPTQFAGTFDLKRPLRLTYRILGITRDGERDVLLLEPVRLEGGER